MSSHVASFTDAWIETGNVSKTPIFDASRPSRTRGLKQMMEASEKVDHVASFTDAWIET